MGNKNAELFKQKMDKLTTVYEAKNSDYGDSFTKSLDKYGIVASLTRMGDKFNRIDNLYDKPFSEVDESLIDSLEDLATYAIMTAIWLEKQVEDMGNHVRYWEDDLEDEESEDDGIEEITFFLDGNPTHTFRKYPDGRTETVVSNIDKWEYVGDDDDNLENEDDEDWDIPWEDDDWDLDWNDGWDNDEDDDDYDDNIDAFLYMLSNIDSEDDQSEDDIEREPDWNDGWHDFDGLEDDPDDFSMDGKPKFRIKKRSKGGLSNKDYWNMIRDLYDEEGD